MIANDVQEILINNDLNDDKYEIEYYIYNVPQNVDNSNEIVILINEIMERPLEFGSNIYQNTISQIQVQAFYPEGYEEDPVILETKLERILEKNKWSIKQRRISSDPTTDRLFSTLQFSKNYERRG